MAELAPVPMRAKTGEAVTIRSARAEDAPALVELMRGVIAESSYTVAEPDEYTMTPERQRGEIREYAVRPGYLFLVAEVEGTIAGYLQWSNNDRRRAAHSGIFSLYLDKAWRARGIGRLLLEQLLAWARAHPLIEKVTLAVFATNAPAIALYEKCGFRREGYCPRDLKLPSGEYLDSVLMYRFVKEPVQGA